MMDHHNKLDRVTLASENISETIDLSIRKTAKTEVNSPRSRNMTSVDNSDEPVAKVTVIKSLHERIIGY